MKSPARAVVTNSMRAASAWLVIPLASCSSLIRPPIDIYENLKFVAEERSRSGIIVTFFGVSTIHLSDGKTSLMVDGFFTRPSLTELIFATLESDRSVVGTALEDARIPYPCALFVAHSHHDHVLDAATVADISHSHVFGSTSALNVIGTTQLPQEKLHVLESQTTVKVAIS